MGQRSILKQLEMNCPNLTTFKPKILAWEAYKVYYEYTVDGVPQSYIKRNQTYPFSTTTHYFYRDENGTAVEAHFITTLGMITSGGLVILCILVGFADIIQCKKRRKKLKELK